MTPGQKGFLLLASRLGNPRRKALTTAQLRTLAQRIRGIPAEERDLRTADLEALGYGSAMAEQIRTLLEDEELLAQYLDRGARLDCVPITRAEKTYPLLLRQRLGLDSPGVLWAKGDISILNTPAVALAGSRELREENRRFAEQVGREAALQGLTLVSGNARGADRTAQEACLDAGGRVISVVADELCRQPLRRNVLHLSELDYDAPFTAQRALSRNRVIHCLGRTIFIAQAAWGKGGTWDGTAKNLRFGWSPVACFADGSEAVKQLEAMGAYPVQPENLRDLAALGEDPKLY